MTELTQRDCRLSSPISTTLPCSRIARTVLQKRCLRHCARACKLSDIRGVRQSPNCFCKSSLKCYFNPMANQRCRSLCRASHDRPFDMILLSDVFWTPASHRPLIETLLKLSFSSSTPIIHFTAGFHSGRRVLRNFLAMAYEEEFEKVGTWYEISTVGEQKEWRDREEVAEVEESQEVRNRWSLVGALRLRL